MPGFLVRGEIWWAFPGRVVGSEQDGRRPVVIVSDTAYNQSAGPRVVVIPLTRTRRETAMDLPVGNLPGMATQSWLLADQLRAIDKQRLRRFIGTLDQRTLHELEAILRDLLALTG